MSRQSFGGGFLVQNNKTGKGMAGKDANCIYALKRVSRQGVQRLISSRPKARRDLDGHGGETRRGEAFWGGLGGGPQSEASKSRPDGVGVESPALDYFPTLGPHP